MTPSEQQTDTPAFSLCPAGFVVHKDGTVDTARGCGHRRCFPSSCEILKRLDPK